MIIYLYLVGAVVGPTFGCLLGQQFQILKMGDRFWYENNIPPSAFTKGMPCRRVRQTSPIHKSYDKKTIPYSLHLCKVYDIFIPAKDRVAPSPLWDFLF